MLALYYRFVFFTVITAIIPICWSVDECPTSDQLSQFAIQAFGGCYTKNFLFGDRVGANDTKCRSQLDASLECWYDTKANTSRVTTCPIIYFTTKATVIRKCLPNGKWEKDHYERYCTKRSQEDKQIQIFNNYIALNICTEAEVEKVFEKKSLIKARKDFFIVLRIIDSVVTFTSLVLLLLLIPWKNKRVMIHRNLLLSFMLGDIFHVLQIYVFDGTSGEDSYDTNVNCSVVFVLLKYLILAQVSWMFSAGFSRFKSFFFVYSDKEYILPYFIVGWGFPLLVCCGIYLPVMYTNPPAEDFQVCWAYYSSYKYHYIIWGPVFIILFMNLLMVIYILMIVISKLRRDNVGKLIKARKAARGFTVLLILLGGSYMIGLYGPDDNIKYSYFRVICVSTQGTLISIFHVFLSKEVKSSAKNKLRKYRSSKLDNNSSSKPTSKTNSEVYGIYNKRFSLFDRRSSVASIKNIPDPMTSNTWVQDNVIDESATEEYDNTVNDQELKSDNEIIKNDDANDYIVFQPDDELTISSNIDPPPSYDASKRFPSNPTEDKDTDSLENDYIVFQDNDTNVVNQGNVNKGYINDHVEDNAPNNIGTKKKEQELECTIPPIKQFTPNSYNSLISAGGDINFGSYDKLPSKSSIKS